jgi:hypothetical protein
MMLAKGNFLKDADHLSAWMDATSRQGTMEICLQQLELIQMIVFIL